MKHGYVRQAGVSCAVLLPGSGSDEVFVAAAFGEPLRTLGIPLIAPVPRAGDGVIAGFRAALDAALDRPGRLLVGGISLGAHVATRWAASAPRDRLAGLLLALPAWTGPAGSAPAAVAARASAARARAGGVAGALAAARNGTPPWLVAELERAWSRHGAGLAAGLAAAAAEPAPGPAELQALGVPAGVAALVDDPVHPLAVARRWCALLPCAALVPARLAAFGNDPAVLGRAAVLGWLRAGGRP